MWVFPKSDISCNQQRLASLLKYQRRKAIFHAKGDTVLRMEDRLLYAYQMEADTKSYLTPKISSHKFRINARIYSILLNYYDRFPGGFVFSQLEINPFCSTIA